MMQGEQAFCKKNIQAFRLTWSDKFFLIQPEAKEPSTQLIIQRSTMTILEQDRSKSFSFKEATQNKPISLVLGIIDIYGCHYLLYVTEVYFAGRFLSHSVYHIATIDHISISGKPPPLNMAQKVAQLLTELQTIFSFGFYFSLQHDITLNYKQILNNAGTNEKFFWNGNLLKPFKDAGLSKGWRIPVMQGYFGSFHSAIGNCDVTYHLISRRSKYKAGTRFYARGLDDDGNCANSVETEQIAKFRQRTMSYLMFRGSVPIFWEQRSLTNNIKLTRNKDLTKAAFIKHISKLHDDYNRILCINLLQKEKPDQHLLIKAYEQMFSQCFNDTWEFSRYNYYDLHDVIKKKTPEKLNMYIYKRKAVLQSFGYFLHDSKNSCVLCYQNGIVRVNCLDGLGRSNTFLYKTAFKVLEMALKDNDIDVEGAFGRSIFDELDAKDCQSFTNNFKYLWAENADFISKMYCGTESYSANLTRLGKRGFLDFIDSSLLSIARVYNSKFEDRLKQQTLDLMEGRVDREAQLSQETKVNNCPFKVFISSWNINAKKPSEQINLWKLFQMAQRPDLVVFCLQQMIDLNPNNVLSEEENIKVVEGWRQQVDQHLKKIGKYIMVDKLCLVGIWLVIFIEDGWKSAVRGVQKDLVRTGMNGKLGNKGAAIIRLKVYESTICFTNVHLESGEKRLDIRIQTIGDIHEKAFQQNIPGVQKQPKIEFSDFKFLIGDMNFRVDENAEKVRNIVKEIESLKKKGDMKNAYKLLDKLLHSDQLLKERRNPQCMLYLAAYNQSPIAFIPTYKFDKQSTEYALKKNRVPSWCDRILLWSQHPFSQKLYNSVELLDSDHRPVVAQYTLQLSKNTANQVREASYSTSSAKQFRESHFDFF